MWHICEHEGAEATLPSFKIQTNVMDVNKMVGTCRNVENEMEPMLIFFPANNTKNDVLSSLCTKENLLREQHSPGQNLEHRVAQKLQVPAVLWGPIQRHWKSVHIFFGKG